MGLRITRKASIFNSKLIFTAMAVFALVAQPMFSFIASEIANAAPLIRTQHVGFSSLTNWENDRSAPSGVHIPPTDNQLILNVDGDNPSPLASNAFYKTEGRKAMLPAGTNSIKATLYVDADWATVTDVRAGMWGATVDGYYPILEFSNINSVAVIRAWDSSLAGWVNIVTNPTLGANYTFEIVHDPIAQKFLYYVNNAITPAYTASATANSLTHVIFNNYNAGIPGNDYSVSWTDFSAGEKLPEPKITNVDAYYSVGTDYTAISTDFTVEDVTDAVSVELRVTRSDNSTYSITAKQPVINAINTNSPITLTGPIVISGSRNSTSWNNQTGTWAGTALPQYVDVIITLAGGEKVEERDTVISDNLATWERVKPSETEEAESGEDETDIEIPVINNGGEMPKTSLNTPDTSTPVVAVTTPVTTTPNEETEEVDQAISSTDDETDVAGEQDAEEKWSLVNALLAAATVILSVIAVAGIRQSEEDSKLIRLLTILPAVGAVGAVLWIEDFTAAGPGWVSPWTLLFAAIIALQVALFRSVDAAEE